jgi:hypothetical protein
LFLLEDVNRFPIPKRFLAARPSRLHHVHADVAVGRIPTSRSPSTTPTSPTPASHVRPRGVAAADARRHRLWFPAHDLP